EARHCRRGGGEARSPGSGRARRRGRGERRRRHRRAAVQRAPAGVGDRHPRAAAAGASADDRLRRDGGHAVEGARGGAGLREVPARGTCAQGVAEEGPRAGVIFRAPRDCRVALSRASAPWHLGDQDKTAISEVDVPPVSKELKKRWSYFIRKVYETSPLICPKCQGEMWFDKLTTLRQLEARIISFSDRAGVIKIILRHQDCVKKSHARSWKRSSDKRNYPDSTGR